MDTNKTSLKDRLVARLAVAAPPDDASPAQVASVRPLVEALRALKAHADANTFKMIYLHILSLLKMFANTDRKSLKTKIRMYLRKHDRVMRNIFEDERPVDSSDGK